MTGQQGCLRTGGNKGTRVKNQEFNLSPICVASVDMTKDGLGGLSL